MSQNASHSETPFDASALAAALVERLGIQAANMGALSMVGIGQVYSHQRGTPTLWRRFARIAADRVV